MKFPALKKNNDKRLAGIYLSMSIEKNKDWLIYISPWPRFDGLLAFVCQHQLEVVFNAHFVALLDCFELVVVSC